MAAEVEREIQRFARRVRLGRLFGGASQALAAVAVLSAGVLVMLRLLGIAWLPQPAFFALLFVPAIAWGLRCAARSGFDRKLSAAHLDRRLGMRGLLLASLERDPAGYRERVFEGLRTAHAALPHLRPRPMALRVLLATTVIGVLFLLPPPKKTVARANPLVAEALEEFEARLEALEEEKGLREETREELAQRFDRMKQQFGQQGELSWADLDKLERTMEHERAMQVARLTQAMQDLEAFARGEDQKAQGGDGAAEQRMQQLLVAAKQAGLLDTLPPSLLERLGQGADGEALDGSGLDAEALKQLAAALAESAGEALEGLDAGDLLDDLALADLDLADVQLTDLGELLDGEPCKLCEGEPDEDCPG